MLDILIKNGTVIDGTGLPANRFDIGIEKGKIREISPNITSKAAVTLNARGKFVAPGFIDIQNHSDSYWTLFEEPEQASLLAQGITTIITGNCGSSVAPLASKEAIKSLQKWHSLEGINIDWASMGEFIAHLRQMKLGVNVGSLVGHATLRRGLLGDEIRRATAEEIKVMQRLLAESLEAGALGLSLGLMYAHEVDSTHEELTALVSLLKVQNKVLNVHLRSEGSQVLEALDEAIEMARTNGVSLKISHLKIRGRHNWHLFGQMINKLETAYHQGLKISFDVYPYDSTWAVLYTYLPKWAYEGGRQQILAHLKDPVTRRKIVDHLNSQNLHYDSMIVAGSTSNRAFVGKNIQTIANNQGISGAEALLNILTAANSQVVIFDHNLSAEQVELLVASPLSMIATDGAGYSIKQKELIHPRCFGTMPRFLRLVRDQKLMKWEEAIKKITGDPAELFGIVDRGVLKKNSAADVVIFDPHEITDKADYQNPDILPEGIEAVIVNGHLAYQDKTLLGLNGQVVVR